MIVRQIVTFGLIYDVYVHFRSMNKFLVFFLLLLLSEVTFATLFSYFYQKNVATLTNQPGLREGKLPTNSRKRKDVQIARLPRENYTISRSI